MSAMQPAPFSWGDISLSESVYVDGVPHVTRRAIGEWLEYGEPKKAIQTILERNPALDEYSTVLNLRTVDGKNREVSVYSPVGFLLIVMESGQPKAHAMKLAVAKFVTHFYGSHALTIKEQVALRNQCINIAAKIDRTSSPFALQVLLSHLQEVSLVLGVPVPDIRLLNVVDPQQQSLGGM